mmetsp:Transcript_123/g.433  ORF Transcript_123/g.433 Transcript_123/m.433 type:complete len:161 (-) Transcript_123:107-589(-)|eukprot:CAMPEP_0117666080 /NCGR_PEP_ID=MMETSP0804-20121206/10169_1 /TAXON_ID=1074897 /ORGANISM="Tetraselmis astigmatica, Strain CCMP880" /LENGTH=160 /DNA_ID=CAMNT_0005473569 /DNA_START=778 /DNA_END=1260 /DNA_ORIENTATION=+
MTEEAPRFIKRPPASLPGLRGDIRLVYFRFGAVSSSEPNSFGGRRARLLREGCCTSVKDGVELVVGEWKKGCASEQESPDAELHAISVDPLSVDRSSKLLLQGTRTVRPGVCSAPSGAVPSEDMVHVDGSANGTQFDVDVAGEYSKGKCKTPDGKKDECI